jgi:hypothetical protein
LGVPGKPGDPGEPALHRFQILHAAALGSLDRSEDAKTVVQRLLELQPGLTVASAILSARYVNPENMAALEDALPRAGLPDG